MRRLVFVLLMFNASLFAKEPPKTISGSIVLAQVATVTGDYFTDGNLLVYFAAEGNAFLLVSLTYGGLESGTYSYVKGDETGRVTLQPSSGGSLTYEFKFNSEAKGEFQVDSFLGTQAGFFEQAWLYYPESDPKISLKNVITNVEDRELAFEVKLEKSIDGKTWTEAEGTWTIGTNGRPKFSYANPEESVFLRIVEP